MPTQTSPELNILIVAIIIAAALLYRRFKRLPTPARLEARCKMQHMRLLRQLIDADDLKGIIALQKVADEFEAEFKSVIPDNILTPLVNDLRYQYESVYSDYLRQAIGHE